MLRDRLAGRQHSAFFLALGGREPARRYMIATTGRAGSTLLCSRIADCGGLGFPNEFMNESYVAEFDRLFPNPSLADYERFISRSFASENGVFGVKTDWWRFFIARDLDFCRSFYEPLDLVVWLKREDFVAQAVSLALANATQVWHVRDDEGDGGLEARHQEVEYDGDAIILHARNILNQEYHWRRFFETSGVPRLDLTYEEVARDVDGAVSAIAQALEVSASPQNSLPDVRKARSGVARSWRERFEAERPDFVQFWREHRGRITASG